MSRRPIPLARGTAMLGALVAALAFAAAAPAAEPPTGDGVGGVGLTKLGSFAQPTYATVAPGRANRKRLFVVERSGVVRVMRGRRVLRRPFLDIRDRVESGDTEQGLLSIAFDPGYVDNRLFYAYYTASDGAITVARFKRARGRMRTKPGTGRTVISVPHDLAPNHNGGQVSFGPDGHMWIGTGDGGGACDPPGNGQSTGSLLGKLLRIDPRRRGGYTIPGGNPFVGRAGADEIYAYGFRNPFRFSFDRDRIAIGDVGQDDWEEINVESMAAARGANFGWDGWEGFAPEPCGTDPVGGTTFPIHAYPHRSGTPGAFTGCSVTGGPVVRDRRLRSLYGRYLYSDFCAGGLRSLVPTAAGGASDDRDVGPRVAKLSAITTGRRGRIYLTSYQGNLYRLDPRERPATAEAAAKRRGGGVRARRIGGFENPVYVTGPRRSRGLLFVVEKRGVIKAVPRRGRPRTFLDIHGRVSDGGERGMLSVAFPPDYRKSRRFYVYYTDNDGDIVVAEFRRSRRHPRKAMAKSRRTVIKVGHPGAPNHNGGQVQFGPDGYLYLGTGDGGGGGDPPENAQDRTSLLGKLLRIDPRKRGKRRYTVPRSNPFVGRSGRDEIYSYGLRNPYRFSFDRRGGRLAIGDVGQDRWEEVDLLSRKAARGANFGWDAFEGFERFRSSDASPSPPGPVKRPIAAFSHAAGNCAITGGYVYRGKAAAKLRGRYVYADFCRGQIRSLAPNRPKRDRPVGIRRFGGISSFGEDARGNLYFADLGSDAVYRIAGKR
ncbi:MAG TPA: PQQ-dependent sugar dehydrogenase [Solirubrobacterales bacterium]|nr:PQQ-dependent sugar dehydrogenase [Solirubrobacterales bacterium]